MGKKKQNKKALDRLNEAADQVSESIRSFAESLPEVLKRSQDEVADRVLEAA